MHDKDRIGEDDRAHGWHRHIKLPRPAASAPGQMLLLRILARLVAALALEPDAPISETQHGPRDLQVARTGLVKKRTRLRNRGHVQSDAGLTRQTKTRLALVERQIAEPKAEIARRIAEDKPVARNREILCSIPGLGPIAAALILTFPPETGPA